MDILSGITSIIILIIFGYINWQIIVSDFRIRKIPNKYLIALIILLPLWWIMTSQTYTSNFSILVLQGSISLFIAFLLYYFQLWGAGDAKYLLILSLYIPHISIIIFIGNITIITLILLLLYICNFFYKELCERYSMGTFKKSISIKKGTELLDSYKKQIFIFLLVFTGIRLGRIHIVQDTYEKYKQSNITILGTPIPSDYLFVGLIICFIGCIFLGRYIIGKIFLRLANTGKDIENIKYVLIYIVSGILLTYITIGFYEDFYNMSQTLVIIFTLYLGIVLCILAIKKMIFFSLEHGERYKISIRDLVPGTVIDDKYLATILKKKTKIINITGYDISTKILQAEDIDKIKKMSRYVKNNIDKNKKEETYIDHIIGIRTVAYAPYILSGFFITLIFGNAIIRGIVESIIYLLVE